VKRLWKIASFLVFAAAIAIVFGCLGPAKTAYASNPTTMSFQGKVVNANGTNVTDGTYSFVFNLYTVASGGSAIWTETDSSVTVTAGVFQVNLGANCPFFTANACNGSTPIDFNANNSLYLGITFNSDPAGEMTPRVQLQSVPFAYNADKVGGLTAAQLVQLTPAGGTQTGAINVTGGNTSINGSGTGNTTLGGATGSIALGGSNTTTLAILNGSSNALTLQSGNAINLTAAAASTFNFGSGNTLSVTASTVGITGNLTATGTLGITGTGASSIAGDLSLSGSGTGLSVTNNASVGGNLAVSDRAILQSTTGTTGQGYFIQNSTPNTLAGFQALDLSGSTFAFFDTNKYYNGTTWVDDGLGRVGSSFQIQNDNFTFYSFDTCPGGVCGFTARLTVASGGNVGVATTTPTSLFSVGTSSQFQVNSSGAIVALTGLANSGGYIQSGSTANTLTGATTLSNSFSQTGANTFSTGTGAISLNGATTLAANDGLTLTSGVGTIVQTYVSTTTGVQSAATINATNSNATATATTVNGLSIGLTGHASGTNTINAVSLVNVTAITGNTFDALNVGTGYTNLLQSANVVITAAGAVTAGLYNGQTITSAASFTGTVNAVTGYEFNGTAGQTVTCTGTQYLSAPVTKGGILTGNAGCASIGLSDARVKTDITTLDNTDALDSIKNVSPVNFYYDCSNPYFAESNTNCDPTYQTGVIAQQLMQIFPNLVTQDSYGYYHVNYQGLSVENLEATREIAQYLDSAGNANLAAVTADSLGVSGNASIGGNLTVGGSITYDNGINVAGGNATVNGNVSATSVITPSLASSGALTINSGGANTVSIDSGAAGGSINIGGSNAAAVNISQNGQTTTVNGALVIDQGSTFSSGVSMNFTGGQNLNVTSDLAGNVNGISFVGTPSTTAGTKNGVFVQQANSVNANGLSGALVIDNASTGTPIGNAIQITNSGGGGYTNLINTPGFSVSGDGNVTANGAFISKNGSFQILDASGSQVVTIDNSGNANFRGNLNLASASLSGGLTIGGNVNVAGLSTFQQLATFLAKTVFKQNVEFDGHITVAGDTAGYAALRVGESTVHVAFTTPYDNPPVVTTGATDGQFVPDSVNNITTTGFDIDIAAPALKNITLSWTAIGVNNPQTASNPLPTPPAGP
jgi:hypothetical protein